jgi:hypothetical protein
MFYFLYQFVTCLLTVPRNYDTVHVPVFKVHPLYEPGYVMPCVGNLRE